MPNTPQHLLKKNRIEDAEKSLRFYRNCNEKSTYDRERLAEEFERFQQIAQQNETTPPVVLKDFGEFKFKFKFKLIKKNTKIVFLV